MFEHTIACDILAHCRIRMDQDEPSGRRLRIEIPIEVTHQHRAIGALVADLKQQYPVQEERTGEGLCLSFTPTHDNDVQCLSELVRYLAARYDFSAHQLLQGCDSAFQAAIMEACKPHGIRNHIRIESMPEDQNALMVRVEKSSDHDAFVEWLCRLYECDRVPDEQGTSIYLKHCSGISTPLTEAQCLADLSHNLMQAWSFDRADVLRCIHPQSARDYTEQLLGMRPAPQIQNMLGDSFYSQDIAIVGTGFSGVAAAIQTLKSVMKDPNGGPIRIRMIERSEKLFAGGVAYGASGYEHHVNVPGAYLSLDPENPDDFVNWLKERGLGHLSPSEPYLKLPKELIVPTAHPEREATQRRLYQYYLMHRLHDYVREASLFGLADVEMLFDEVMPGLEKTQKGHKLTLSHGREIDATHVIYATGHGVAQPPHFLSEAAKNDPSHIVVDQWNESTKLEALLKDPTNRNVVVLGTGLSAMDVVMTAQRVGFFNDPERKLTLLSRGGNVHPVMEEGQDYHQPEASIDDFGPLPTKMSEVVAYVTGAFETLRNKDIATIGRPHTNEEIFFALTPLIPEFLRQTNLPVKELMTLLKDHGSLINTSAVPMASVIGHAFHEHLSQGQIILATGDTQSIEQRDGQMTLSMKNSADQPIRCQAVISSLPPSSDPMRHPLYSNLIKEGTFRIEPRTGIGLDIDPQSMRPLDEHGAMHKNIFVIGPVVGGAAMVNFGNIGPLSQIVAGLKEQALRTANCLAEARRTEPRPTVAILMNTSSTGEAALSKRWAEAVQNYGLRPLLIKPGLDELGVARVLEQVDGVLLTGADSNVFPELYDQVPEPGQEFDHSRDMTATALVYLAQRHKVPILGICRGMQDMNVALFGSLDQKLEGHDQGYALPLNERGGDDHTINIAQGGHFEKIYKHFGDRPMPVSSIHRQGFRVDQMAEPLQVEALAHDGVVEGISLPVEQHPFFVGCQFHPEFNSLREVYAPLFLGFARAINERHRQPRLKNIQVATSPEASQGLYDSFCTGGKGAICEVSAAKLAAERQNNSALNTVVARPALATMTV